MSETKFLKCICTQCGGHIEFPADGIGSTVPCPHCGWQTELTLAAPEPTSARSPRSLKWAIVGAAILLIGLAGAIGALVAARNLVRRSRGYRAVVQAPGNAAAATSLETNRNGFTPDLVTNGFAISQVKIHSTPGSSLVYAVGLVKNEADKQRFGVTVELDLLDPAGKKIGAAKDYKEVLEPRAEWPFHALVVAKDAHTARVTSIHELP